MFVSTLIDFDVLLSFVLQMDSTSSFNRETDNMDDAGNIQTPDSTTGKRKETEKSSGATNNVKCILPTRYKVWEHYTRTKEDRNKCVCNYCHNTFSCLTSSGTSNLKSHLENVRVILLGRMDKKISSQPLTMKGNLRRQS